ncbi:hypothetical protein [Streptomyces candidus]|uniref:Uncharacterized protein n=1 Tax=Streptomyces candidus TaxID=67283 RepID=A0A7X0LQ69_9ACTN|nr:hypothetical protein [Streptomyces candidus]MBB6436184.1 hypothetical protein [Streptomyces candidus]GHH43913.1 hypothetical protein GCM10018773_30940 [Streptomyces candidus]
MSVQPVRSHTRNWKDLTFYGPPAAPSTCTSTPCSAFGNGGGIADNDPGEQEKTAKFNALLSNGDLP